MADLSAIRALAATHEHELTMKANGLGVSDLAQRWGVCPNTVRDIPRAHLPYMEFGKGRKYKRRRYDLADVEAYEDWDKGGRQGDPPGARYAAAS